MKYIWLPFILLACSPRKERDFYKEVCIDGVTYFKFRVYVNNILTPKYDRQTHVVPCEKSVDDVIALYKCPTSTELEFEAARAATWAARAAEYEKFADKLLHMLASIKPEKE